MNASGDLKELALAYHRRLPPAVKAMFARRGVPEPVLCRYRIGWDRERITIPITNRDRQVVFFKLLEVHQDRGPSAFVASSSRLQVELYGWERVVHKRVPLVICEGEFDRLVLEGQGFAAVCSTAGAASFLPEWALHFKDISDVFICFRNDTAGRGSAARLAALIPHSRIVDLPGNIGEGAGVADFFGRSDRGAEDFTKLLDNAVPRSAPDRPGCHGTRSSGQSDPETVESIKARVRIEKLIGQYLPLESRGAHLVGKCPFHAGDDVSFTVYPTTQSFHCFGCRAYGDVLSFLMRKERLDMVEALERLMNLQ